MTTNAQRSPQAPTRIWIDSAPLSGLAVPTGRLVSVAVLGWTASHVHVQAETGAPIYVHRRFIRAAGDAA